MINLNNVEAILFDFGGTLDTDGIHWSIKFWETYQKFQIPVSYEEFSEAYINTEPEVNKFVKKDDNLKNTLSIQILLQLKYLKEKGIYISDDEQKIADKLAEYCFNDVAENIQLIRPQLEELNERYKLALVSNFYGNVVSVCKHLNIFQYFAIIVDSYDIAVSKPDPEIFNIALKKLNAYPANRLLSGILTVEIFYRLKSLAAQLFGSKAKVTLILLTLKKPI